MRTFLEFLITGLRLRKSTSRLQTLLASKPVGLELRLLWIEEVLNEQERLTALSVKLDKLYYKLI